MNQAGNSAKAAQLIRETLGHVRTLQSTATARTVTDRSYPLTQGATGVIGDGDALFLLSLLEQVRPHRILELGVAAGASTLLMLEYFSAIGSRAALTSVDILDFYSWDRSKRLAYLVFDNLPSIPVNWMLIENHGAANFSKAAKLQGQVGARHYDFLFIDALHGHPWPTLDTLCLLPFTVPGSWVALHDVSLTMIDEKWAARGPQFLLQNWPLDACLSDDPIPNIGAIRLSDAGVQDVEHLLKVLEVPWEYDVPLEWERMIIDHLHSFLTTAQMKKMRSAFGH